MAKKNSNEEIKCLFCDENLPTLEQCIGHMKREHKFNFYQIKKNWELDFYQCIKLLNFIRLRVNECVCPYCSLFFDTPARLQVHFQQSLHFALPIPAPYYFFDSNTQESEEDGNEEQQEQKLVNEQDEENILKTEINKMKEKLEIKKINNFFEFPNEEKQNGTHIVGQHTSKQEIDKQFFKFPEQSTDPNLSSQQTSQQISSQSSSSSTESSPTSDQQNSNSQSKDITDFDVDKLAMEILGNDDGIGLDHFFVKQVSNIDGEDKLSCPRHEIERQDEEIKGDINTQVESGNDLGLKFAFESHCQVQRFSQDWQQDSNLFSVIADDPLLDLAGSEEDETDIPLINEEEEEFNQGQKIDNKELNEIEANKKYDWVYDKEKERQKEKELIDVNKKKRNKQLTGLLEAEEEEDDDDDDDVEEEDKQTNDGQLKDAVESDIPINGPKIDKTIIVGSKKKKQSKVLWAWQKLDD